jgi:MFS transporter, YNFM family, putative membrane transport protein
MVERATEDRADAVIASGESAAAENVGALPPAISASAAGVVAVTLAGIAAFLNLYSTQPLLPMFAKMFSASKSAVGMTISASTLGVALSAPFCGLLAERIGRKRVIVAATLLLSVPTMLAATSSSLRALIFWRFLQGVVMPGIFGVTIAYITEEWPAANVARVMSIYVSGTVFGGFLGRVLMGYPATHRIIPGVAPSWHIGFVIVGLCDLVFAFVIARWLPPDRRSSPRVLGSSFGGSILRHLRNPQLVTTYLVGFNVLFSLVAIFTYITFYLAADPYHLTPAQLSWLFAVYLVGLVVTPLAGVWIGKVGSRVALMAAVFVSMAGVSLTLVHNLPIILVGLVLCSSGVFVCQSASTTYIHVAAPAGGRASAAGLYVAWYYVGGSVAGVLPGYFWRFGGWTACVALVLVVQLLTIAMAASAWKPAR